MSRTVGQSVCWALAGILAELCLGLAQSGCTPADEAPDDSIATFAADANLRYALAIDACVDAACPVRVRLERDGRLLDAFTLDWPAPSRDVEEIPAGAGFGIGDVLAPAAAIPVWTAAFDDTGYAVTAQPVRLSQDRVALLVTQRMGLEPAKRRHELLFADDDHLVSAWARTEGTGPTWSTARVLPFVNGREQVLYADAYLAGSAGADEADRVTMTVVRWNDDTMRPVESPADDVPLDVVSFGAHDTVTEAYAAKGDCLFNYWILDAASYDGLPTHGYFIGAVTSDAALARSALAEAAACSSPVQGNVLRYSQRR